VDLSSNDAAEDYLHPLMMDGFEREPGDDFAPGLALSKAVHAVGISNVRVRVRALEPDASTSAGKRELAKRMRENERKKLDPEPT
jgi:hypothetical protein